MYKILFLVFMLIFFVSFQLFSNIKFTSLLDIKPSEVNEKLEEDEFLNAIKKVEDSLSVMEGSAKTTFSKHSQNQVMKTALFDSPKMNPPKKSGIIDSGFSSQQETSCQNSFDNAIAYIEKRKTLLHKKPIHPLSRESKGEGPVKLKKTGQPPQVGEQNREYWDRISAFNQSIKLLSKMKTETCKTIYINSSAGEAPQEEITNVGAMKVQIMESDLDETACINNFDNTVKVINNMKKQLPKKPLYKNNTKKNKPHRLSQAGVQDQRYWDEISRLNKVIELINNTKESTCKGR